MANTSVVTHPSYGGTNRDDCFSLVVDDSGVKYFCNQHVDHINTCIKYIIQCNWIVLGSLIVELVWIETINKDMSPCLCQDMCIVPCINISTKYPHAPNMRHTNRINQIIGPKLSGNLKKATNLSSHLTTENIYKRW